MTELSDSVVARATTGSDNSAYLSLLLADGRLPTGAHTQSAGVEPALNHGVALADVPAYLRVRLTTVTEVEAATAAVARHHWSDTPTAEAMTRIDRAWRVRTASRALRDAADLLGRSYLRLAASAWPALRVLTAHRIPWCRAVAVGATAAEAGLDAEQTARLIGFEDVQTVIAATLKLRPFDPAEAVAWSIATAPEVEALVDRVVDCRDLDDIPAYAAPQIEQWAELHTRTERRLFRA